MKPSDYKKLEEDKEFKRYYLKKTLWWKNFLFIAPMCLMFVGLAGILQMGYRDELFSLYAIPYIVVFAIGTIWLKALKKHVQDKMLSKKHIYLACAAKLIGSKGGRYYFIFSKDNKRHNESLIDSIRKELNIDAFSTEELTAAKKSMIEIETSEQETKMYLKAIAISNAQKANKQCSEANITPLLYVSKKDIFVIQSKYLKS